MKFVVEKTSGNARATRLTLAPLESPPRGLEAVPRVIETPAFMPVGTQATVKGILPEELSKSGTQMILCNTYHLIGRPGAERVKLQGGLHRFMNWGGGIITDSGGFQVYSLAKLRKIDDNGVDFQHHIDGITFRLEAETALETQKALGSDIAMVLDECPALPADRETLAKATERTLKWAKRSEILWQKWQNSNERHPQIFAICQGGTDSGLRIECAQALSGMNFPGYALGGFAVGEEREISYAVAEKTLPHLPSEKPRYLMGVGTPEELVTYAGMGVDLFDCVLPTRNARNGQLYTRSGKIIINHSRYADDESPIDPECRCPTCRSYSRAYLRHLFTAKEILSSVLNTIHNLYYYQDLVRDMRRAVLENRYPAFEKEFLELQKVGESA